MPVLEQPMKVALVALLLCLLALLPTSSAFSHDDQDMGHALSPLEHDLRRLVLEDRVTSPSFMEAAMSVGAAKYEDYCTATKLKDLKKKLPLTASRTSETVTQDDLICYYASPIFNLEGLYGKGGSPVCNNGIHLSTATKGDKFDTFGETELATLKQLIFDVSRDKGSTTHADVATTTTLETVKRSFSNQRVLLFLFDADSSCAYPVAHNVYPASDAAPKNSAHTEAILKDIGLLDREGMLSVVNALYATNLASAKNLVRVLYTWYAPCENCSNTLMTKYKATTSEFKGNVILFNRAVCNGVKDYRAECLAVTANYDSDLTAVHQIAASKKISSENSNSSAARKARLNAPKTTLATQTASKLRKAIRKDRDLKARPSTIKVKQRYTVKATKGDDAKAAVLAKLRRKKAAQNLLKKQ